MTKRNSFTNLFITVGIVFCLICVGAIFLYELKVSDSSYTSQAGYAYTVPLGTDTYRTKVGDPVKIDVGSETLRNDLGYLKDARVDTLHDDGMLTELHALQNTLILTPTKPGKHYASLFFEKSDGYCTVYSVCIDAE